jgi:hypothetical protein
LNRSYQEIDNLEELISLEDSVAIGQMRSVAMTNAERRRNREAHRRWREKNLEHDRARCREWARTHKEVAAARTKKWQKDNRERYLKYQREYAKKRRAADKDAPKSGRGIKP